MEVTEREGYRILDHRGAAVAAAGANLRDSQVGTAAMSGFDGANWSPHRGYVYFPNLDTRKEIDGYTRVELLRRARYLYANNGFARRCINGASRLVVGRGLSPFPTTEDAEWNEEVLRRWKELAKSPAVLDVSGRYSFPRSQLAVMRCLLRDGDVFPVLTESENKLARLVFYEAHQVGGEWQDLEEEKRGWYDGVRLNRMGKAVAYRIRTARGGQVVPAENVLAVMGDERMGARRGVTVLYHAINNMLDRIEIASFMKLGIKIRNEIGFAVESEDSGAPGLGMTYGRSRTARVTSADGTEQFAKIEDVYRGGGKIADLGAGRKIRTVESQHPSANEVDFLNYLARDIAWGMGLAPELLWDISKLGGANTRFILDDAQTFVEEHQQLLTDSYLARFWVYFVAKELKYRGLREPRGSRPWWEHGWMPPARRTVDYGRDGKLHLLQHEKGMRTLKRHYEELGLDWRAEVDQELEEKAYRARRLAEVAEREGIPPEELRGVILTPTNGVSEGAADDAEDEEEESPGDVGTNDGL